MLPDDDASVIFSDQTIAKNVDKRDIVQKKKFSLGRNFHFDMSVRQMSRG